VVKPQIRISLTAVSAVYIAAVAYLFGDVPLKWFNLLLAVAVVPMVWLIGVFCNWSAHQHGKRYARDVEKVHGRRPETAGRVRR
jgi:membrane protein YdbS with pleckstrin-like domain